MNRCPVPLVPKLQLGNAIPQRASWQDLLRSAAPLLTTSLVLIEIGGGLSRVRHRRLALEIRDRLSASPRVEIVQTGLEEETRAWSMFRDRSDKEWGMTACVSIVVAQDRGVRDVFSVDHHFEQAGFNVVLKR